MRTSQQPAGMLRGARTPGPAGLLTPDVAQERGAGAQERGAPPLAPRRYLHFGDVITLYNDDDARGWMSIVPGDTSIRVDQLETNIIVPPNLRDCRFAVVPSRRYVAMKKLRKELESTGREATLDKLLNGDTSERSKRRSSKTERQLTEQTREEWLRNIDDEKAALGQPVTFGASVQLRHLATGMFVTRRKAMARVERECFKVESHEFGDDGSHWIVLPVYKYRENGQKVPFNDAVLLKTQGSGGYLRVGGLDMEPSIQLHPDYVENVYEANIGINQSRWIVLPYRTVEEQTASVIRGGDVIFINHQESGSLLTWVDDGMGITAGVGFVPGGQSVQREAAALTGIPAHTNAIWKVEAQHVQWAGLRAVPGRLYRLKNVGSSLYLALDKVYGDAELVGEATLSSDYMGMSCLWEFVPVDHGHVGEGGGDVDLKNVFLRHSSGAWLRNKNGTVESAEQKEPDQHLGFTRLARSDCHEVDWARVRRKQMMELVEMWHHGRGQDPEFFEQKAAEGADVLRQVLHFLNGTAGIAKDGPPPAPPPGWDALQALGQPLAASQRLLRELGVIDVVVQLLGIIVPWVAENEEGDPPDIHLIACYGHWMLRSCCIGSAEAKQHIGQHVSIFIQSMAQVAPRSVKAVELLAELLTDNRPMVRELKSSDINEFMNVYIRYRRPQDLQLLASLCMVEGAPMAFVQNLIIKRLLKMADEFLPRVEWLPDSGGARGMRICARSASGDPCSEIIAGDIRRSSRLGAGALTSPEGRRRGQGAGLLVLMERTTELMASCAFGRNEAAHGALRAKDGWRSREGLVEIASDPRLSRPLRTGALRLLLCLYVDQEPLSRKPTINYTRLWSRVATDERSATEKARAPAHTLCIDVLETTYVCLRDALKVVQQYHSRKDDSPRHAQDVEDGRQRTAEVEGAVKMTATCSWGLGLMVDLGALAIDMDDRRVRSDVTRFCDLLVGALEHDGFQDIGADACAVLSKLFDLRVDVRISSIFQAYDDLFERENGDIFPVPERVLQKLRKDMFETAIISEKVTATNSEGFSQTLMNVMNFGDVHVSLRRKAFRLLFRHTAQPAHLIREIKKVTPLALAEAAEVHAFARKAAVTLSRQTEKIAMECERIQPKGSEIVTRVVPEECQSANTTAQSILAQLSTLLRRDDEFSSDIPTTKGTPRLGSANEKGQILSGKPPAIVKKYQDVLRNAGVHASVFDILYLPLRRTKMLKQPDEADNPDQLDTFQECYAFLRLFCRDNKDNQEIVFKHLPHFIRHVGVKNLNAADTIGEAARDNPGLSAQVDDKLLRTFIQAIVKYGKRARWLRLMESFIKANGKPVQRNQDRILNMVLAEEGETVLELDGDQGGDGSVLGREGSKTRYDLMLENEHETAGMQSFLKYHVTCVGLLAGCCQSNRANMQKVSALISLQTTLENIICVGKQNGEFAAPKCEQLLPSTVRYVKRAFVAFLHYVHLDSKQNEPFAELQTRDAIWGVDGIMNDFCIDMVSFCECISTPAPSEMVALQRHQQLMQYVLEAVLPLLAKFFASARKDGPFTASGGNDFTNFAVVERLVACCADAAFATADAHCSVEHLKVARDLMAQITQKYMTPQGMASPIASPGSHSTTSRHTLDKSASRADALAPMELSEDVLEKIGGAVEKIEIELEVQEKEAVRDKRTPMEQEADSFKTKWSAFWKAFAQEVGVNPTQTVGIGLRRLVVLLGKRKEVMGNIADLLHWNGDQDSVAEYSDKVLHLSGLRALRAWLHLGDNALDVDDETWEDFLAGHPPQKCTQQLADRQELAAQLRFIPTVIELVGSGEPLVAKEALQLMTLLTHGHHAVTGSTVQDAVLAQLEIPTWQTGTKPFLVACRDLIRQSIQGLKERKKLLKRKKAEREAKRQAQRMRENRSQAGSDAGTDQRSETGSVAVSQMSGATALLGSSGPMDEEGGDQAMPFIDGGNILEVLSILANLSKGGHRKLQCLLATTAGDDRQTLLGELSMYLTQVEPQISVTSSSNKQPLQVMERIYCAIREMVRSNHDGFTALLATKTFDATCRIMQHMKYDGSLKEQKCNIRVAVFMLVRTLLQGLTTTDTALATTLGSSLDTNVFLEAWKEVSSTRLQRKKSLSGLPHGDEADLSKESTLAFIVLNGLADNDKQLQQRLRHDDNRDSFELCDAHIRTVEVQLPAGLARLRFSMTLDGEELARGARFRQAVEALKLEATKAEDDETRHKEFQDGMQQLVCNEIRERKLKDKPGLGRLHHRRDQVRSMPLMCTLLLNAVLLFCEPIIFPAQPDENATAANASEATQLAVAEWLLPVGRLLMTALSSAHVAASCVRLLHSIAVHFAFADDGTESSDAPSRTDLLRSALRGRVGFELVFTLFSFSGLFISPYFFTFHILELMDTPPVRLLLDCVLSNAVKLGQNAIVIVLIVYLYSVVGFKLFPEKHEDGKCQTLLSCFLSYFDGGLTGGGIHGILTGFDAPATLWEMDYVPWLLTMMQVSYFTIYVVVLLGVFSGIIIDSFGQLRDETNEVNERLRTRCFISGLEKSVIEQAGGEPLPFWSYVEFFIYRDTADKESFSELECYVHELVQAGDPTWLPLRKCIAITQSDGEEEKQCIVQAVKDEMGARFQALERLLVQQQQSFSSRLAQLEQGLAHLSGAGAPTSSRNLLGAMRGRSGGEPDAFSAGSPRSPGGASEAEAALRAKLQELRAKLGPHASPRASPKDR